MIVIDFSTVVFSYAEPTAAEIRTTSDIVCSAGGAVMFKLNVVRLPVAVVGFAAVGRPPAAFGPPWDPQIADVAPPGAPPPGRRVWARARPGGTAVSPRD